MPTQRSKHRRAAGVFALLLAFPLALLGPALLPGKRLLPHLPVSLEPLATEYPDAARAAEPRLNYSTSDRIFPALSDQIAIRRALASGSLPTWEPHLGLGFPLFAGSMVGALHPLHWLAALFPPDAVAGVQALLALLIAGAGTWLLLCRLGASPGACAVGALAVQGGGWGIANVEYFMKLDAAISLPWQLWAVEGLRRGKRGAGRALALATGASFLAGFPPIAVFALGTAGVFALARCPGTPRPGGYLARAALFAGIGVAISAAQLIPTAEASGQSIRQDANAQTTRADALPVLTTLGVVVPDAFGAPTDPPHQDAAAWWVTPGEQWEVAYKANPLEWNTYIGVSACLLAIVALVARPRRALLPALLLAGVYGFAQAWPGVRWIYHLPGFGLGSPGRVLAVAWVLWPWLAGLGAGALLQREPRARAALVAGALLLAGGGWALRLQANPETWPAKLETQIAERYERPLEQVHEVLPRETLRADAERLRGSANFLLCAALAGLAAGLGSSALARRAQTGSSQWWSASPLLVLLFAEALLSGRAHVAARDTSGLDVFPPSAEIARIAETVGDGRLLRIDPHLPAGSDVLALARPSLLQPYGVGDLATWIIFTPRRLADLVRALHPGSIHGRQIAGLPDPELLGDPLLDRLRVTAVLSIDPLQHPRLSLVHARPGFHLYSRAGSLPIARVVPSAARAESAELASGLVTSGIVDPYDQVVLESAERDAHPSVAGDGSPGEVVVARPAANRLDVHVTGSGGGWLVMQEQYFPGWKCNVNGEDADVLCADGTFRAVRIPPGDALVRTWYEPWSLRIGTTLSLLALVAALVYGRGRRPLEEL